MPHPSKAAIMAKAQAAANHDGKTVGLFNLNRFGMTWIVRDLQHYDPRRDANQVDKLYIRPAPLGCYILVRNGKPIMNFAGRVPVYLDGMHAQAALQTGEGYRPIEIQELADRDWYYVSP